MKNALLLTLLLSVFVGSLTGCTQPDNPKGYEKDNFKATPPPPGYGPAGGATENKEAPAKTDGN